MTENIQESDSKIKAAIRKARTAHFANLTDAELMNYVYDVVYGDNMTTRALGKRTEKSTIALIAMSAGFEEIYVRRERLFTAPDGADPEAMFKSIFDQLQEWPSAVATALTSDVDLGDPKYSEAWRNFVTMLAMTVNVDVRPSRFKGEIDKLAAKYKRKEAKKKRKEVQMSSGRFWTIVALCVIGFLILVGSQ